MFRKNHFLILSFVFRNSYNTLMNIDNNMKWQNHHKLSDKVTAIFAFFRLLADYSVLCLDKTVKTASHFPYFHEKLDSKQMRYARTVRIWHTVATLVKRSTKCDEVLSGRDLVLFSYFFIIAKIIPKIPEKLTRTLNLSCSVTYFPLNQQSRNN